MKNSMEAVSPYFETTQRSGDLSGIMTIAAKMSRKRANEEMCDSSPPVQMMMMENVPPVKEERCSDVTPVKKRRDRFNGTTEEEVMKMTLPDRIKPNLDILIIGINPGLTAAYVGHHYAGPGNHFWKCMYASGLLPEPLTAFQDERAVDYGIGLCNIVNRTTRGSNNLSRKEIKEGGEILKEKIKQFKPKIAVFNGKGIYEIFCGNKKFNFGKQPEPLPGTDTLVYVMPSSSARCAHLPRAADKIPFYIGLKKLREHMCGRLSDLLESEVCFPDLQLSRPSKVKTEPAPQFPPNVQLENGLGGVIMNGHTNHSHHSEARVNNVFNGFSSHIKLEEHQQRLVNGFASEHVIPKGTVHHIAGVGGGVVPNGVVVLPPQHEDIRKLSSSPGVSGTRPTKTGTGTPSSAANPNLTSRQGSTPVSNRQSMLSRNQEAAPPQPQTAHTWTRPSVPATSSNATVTDSIAHIPCTSSAVLTSEWINKHFNQPAVQPVYLHNPWGLAARGVAEQQQQSQPQQGGGPGSQPTAPGVVVQHPWGHMAAPPHGGVPNGYLKPEMPSDGYGSVPPSR